MPIEPDETSINDLLAMLGGKDQQMRWCAVHSLGELGPEMDDHVIESVLAHAYPYAKYILIQLARVTPNRIAAAIETLVLKNSVFPTTAMFDSGPPVSYVGEQIRSTK